MTLSLVDAGRASVVKLLLSQTLVLAVGRGDPAWDATPVAVPLSATALQDPIGVLRPAEAAHAVLEEGGDYAMTDGSEWSASVSVTPHLLTRFVADFDDAEGETLREMALYLNPTIDGAIPPGQIFIPWASVTAPGDLYAVERFAAIVKTAKRLEFQRVVTL